MKSKLNSFRPHYTKCDFCGKEFYSIRKWHIFCNTKCRTLSWRKKNIVMNSEILERIEKIENKIKDIQNKKG